jgi:hypothetical protein
MLTGHNLVYFGPEKWDGLWRNRHHLMSRFAEHNRVLYVEPKISLRDARRRWREGRLRWHDLKRNRITAAAENLYIYHNPDFIPISGRYPLDRTSWFLWKGLLKRAMRKLGFDDPIIWVSRPEMVTLMSGFDETLTIYHVVDEYLSYHRDDVEARKRHQAMERQILAKADVVIVVSENLLEAKRPFNEHTYLVPNGVDYQAYAQVLEGHEPPPPDIAQLRRPVIGYSGSVKTRLDLGLLHHVAAVHPEWSIALVGQVDEKGCAVDLARLRDMENVYFLGRKEIGQVARYVQAFDVCLIPYRVDERAQNASPLKLYDYLALGKPIVSTGFAVANQFRDVVRIADDRATFTRQIEEALCEEDQDLAIQRRRIAAQNTWGKRVDELSRIIESHLVEYGRKAGCSI